MGGSPDYWIASASTGTWTEAQGTACDVRFGAVLNQCSAGASHAGLSLLQALDARQAGDQAELGKYVSAAYLNTLSGKSAGFLTMDEVQQMASGSFTPAVGGATWKQDKIVAYLKLTMNQDA